MTVILRDNSSPTPANGSQSSYFDKVEIDFLRQSTEYERVHAKKLITVHLIKVYNYTMFAKLTCVYEK